jgi:uncharacterized membrane protein YeaQ/YmgE (transglycosylase-associated protein family)
MSWLWFILIGIAAGWIASQIVSGGGYGLIMDVIIGVIGALIGGWLFSEFGIVPAGHLGSLLTATAGAILLLLVLRLFSRRRVAT